MPRLHLIAFVAFSVLASCTDPPVPAARSDASPDAAPDGGPVRLVDAGAVDAAEPIDGFARVMVPMRDGVRLATDVARPSGPDRVPAILIRTPYWSQLAGVESIWLPFVGDGYAIVVQTCRGVGDSEGELDPMLQEFADGTDAVRWIAAQPWSNGRIATAGGSYEGFTALAAAVDNPEVVLVLADGAITDAFGGWPGSQRGIPTWQLLWWTHLLETDEDLFGAPAVLETATNHRPFRDLDVALFGEERPIWRAFVGEYEHDGPFWRDRGVVSKVDRICAPILSLEADLEWVDDPLAVFLAAAERGCAEASPAHRFLLGGHGHAGAIYAPAADDRMGRFIRAHLDEHLRGEPALAGEPRVLAYVRGADRWLESDVWPPPASPQTFYLDPATIDGYTRSLVRETGADGAMSISFDPATSACDPATPPEGLWLVSAALDAPLAFAGVPAVELTLSATTPDADVFVQLYDVAPGAASFEVVTLGALRLRFREGRDAPRALEPGREVEVSVPLTASAYQFPVGHAIGLYVSLSECGYAENPNTGRAFVDETEARATTVTVRTGGARSSLVLPSISP